MSNLVTHARRELELLGVEKEMVDHVCKVVEAFAEYGHSGGSASWTIHILNELLQFNNLTPLTNDPKEWNNVGDGVWQSARNSEAFSQDGGKSYYLLSEISEGRDITHMTSDKAAMLAQAKEDDETREGDEAEIVALEVER